jgi:hypothetical protein
VLFVVPRLRVLENRLADGSGNGGTAATRRRSRFGAIVEHGEKPPFGGRAHAGTLLAGGVARLLDERAVMLSQERAVSIRSAATPRAEAGALNPCLR